MESRHNSSSAWFEFKVAILVLLLLVDLGINSSAEYDNFEESKIRTVHVLLVAAQFLIQVSIFSVIFLMMCDTFLFQVGLLGPLAREFRFVFVINAIYILLSVLLGSCRIENTQPGSMINELWENKLYMAISTIHKLVAPIYYSSNLRSAVHLGSTKFFIQEEWFDLNPSGGNRFDSWKKVVSL
mmetsp:Transcript_634/g.762  ORF Transcript_634/g.762 Transcript_634/m.762 type:complete len:184 (+) Transcript_634:58-609(+)